MGNQKKNAGPSSGEIFRSNDDLLEAARQMFRVRSKARAGDDDDTAKKKDRTQGLWVTAAELARAWHRSILASGKDAWLCARMRTLRLSQPEKEILAALILDQLGLLEDEIDNVSDLCDLCVTPGQSRIRFLRLVGENSRLCMEGLILLSDLDKPIARQEIFADPALVDALLADRRRKTRGWTLRSESDFWKRFAGPLRVFKMKVEEMDDYDRGYGDLRSVYSATQSARRVRQILLDTLACHPDWKVSRFFTTLGTRDPAEQTVLLLLAGRALNSLPDRDDLFTGLGLARAVADGPDEVRDHLSLFHPGSPLRNRGLIQASTHSRPSSYGLFSSWSRLSLELTEKALNALGVTPAPPPPCNDDNTVRAARFPLSQVILAQPVRNALGQAMAQARGGEVLLKEWGLGACIPYGRAVTLLFAGPPGVGKTAAAEGLAYDLERPLLSADIARVRNLYIGETEKNISRIFEIARRQNAVLLWDEADAFLYDRDRAVHSWELSMVNTLLGELESFEGVCIMATNRMPTLDAALERRISLKVKFKTPDRKAREKIWRIFLPKTLPLSPGVKVRHLAREELTGGEIKNCVLNAARRALSRSPDGPVTHDDLMHAVQAELQGRWCNKNNRRIGFPCPKTEENPENETNRKHF